jgi:hypothetical protein
LRGLDFCDSLKQLGREGAKVQNRPNAAATGSFFDGSPAEQAHVPTPKELAEYQAFQREEIDRLRHLRKNGVYKSVGIGLLAALACLFSSYYISGLAEYHLRDLLRDCGIGFLVSALAVFGYERLNTIADINGAWLSLRSAATQLERSTLAFDRVVRDHRDGAIDKLLQAKCQGLVGVALQDAVRQIDRLCKASDGNPGDIKFAIQGQKAFVKNIEQLANFRSDKESCEVQLPDSRTEASRVLGNELSRLTLEGDAYESVSDPLFYGKGHMGDFQKDDLLEAFGRGVRIRRIFNMSRMEDDPALAKYKGETAWTVIDRHLKFAKKHEEHYAVRFIGRAGFLDLGETLGFDPESAPYLKADTAFFGLFLKSAEENRDANATLVVGQGKWLTKLAFSRVAQYSEAPTAFTELWERSMVEPPFTEGAFDATALQTGTDA